MRRLLTRLEHAEALLPAPPPVVINPDLRRKAEFWEKHPRFPVFKAATDRIVGDGPLDADLLYADAEWTAIIDELDADFWRAEYAARARRGTPCHCRSFEHPVCQPAAPSDLAPHQVVPVDFALWLVPSNAEKLIADRPAFLEFVGRGINEHFDSFGPERGAEFRQVLASGYRYMRLPEDVIAWAAESFAGFIAEGGAADAIAWLNSLYAGEFRP